MKHRIVTKEGLDEIVDEIYKIVPIDKELFFCDSEDIPIEAQNNKFSMVEMLLLTQEKQEAEV